MRRWAGVDRPVFFAALGQAWSLFSGPISIFLIARYFSPKIQGYYYTFGSVAQLQVFLELGFSQCIIQFASHEFALLRFGPGGSVEGEAHARSRLISLGRVALKWYCAMAALAIVGLALGGSWFFWTKHDPTVPWVLPWLCMCVSAGLTLATMPVGALLEGCNQMGFIYALRTVARAASGVVLWIAVWAGAGLYTGPIMASSMALVLVGAYLWRWPGFLRDLWKAPVGKETIPWQEMWPFQWRIAISCISGYFIFNFFNPVLFYFHGAVVAGQMGVTLSLVHSLNALAQSWSVAKGPRFGMLISRRQFAELDSLFFKSTAQALGACVVGGAVFILGLVWVRAHFAIGARFLSPGPASLLVLATVLNQVLYSEATYLRAHKREPFFVLSAANGVATACLVTVLGYFFSAWGASLAFALTQIGAVLWATRIWQRCRRDWHQPESAPSPGAA
jgi:hypothetical protein